MWLTPAQALARARSRPTVAPTPDTAFFCLLAPELDVAQRRRRASGSISTRCTSSGGISSTTVSR